MADYSKSKTGPEGWRDIRSALPLWLGERLIYMAQNCRGYPVGVPPEDWRDDLMDRGHALFTHGSLDAEGRDEAEVTIDEARKALRWVADNLEKLWD